MSRLKYFYSLLNISNLVSQAVERFVIEKAECFLHLDDYQTVEKFEKVMEALAVQGI
jgi:hypothetical protein